MAKAKETVETKKETKKNVHEVVIKIEGEEWSKALDTAPCIVYKAFLYVILLSDV